MDGTNSEESSTSLSEEPRVCAVSESLYTDNLEAILQDLEASGKKLEITHTARPSEVKQHLEKWVQSMRDELEGHVKIGSFSRHVGDEARELLATPGAEVLPSLAVYTAKPPKPGSPASFRRKTRAVACGNWTGVTSEDSTYSAGAQAEAVRTALAAASSEGLAGLCNRHYPCRPSCELLFQTWSVLILLRPPAHYVAAGLCSASEVWRAQRAIYGLRESPRWRGDYRDQTLRESKWKCGEETMHLEQLEGSVWVLKTDAGERRGIVVVYVDDCLILSSDSQAEALHHASQPDMGNQSLGTL